MKQQHNIAFLLAIVSSLYCFAPSASADATGAWSWFNGAVVSIEPNGTMRTEDQRNQGTWTSRGDTYTLHWQVGGWVDTLRLSADGQRLDGRNQHGTHVWGTRQ